MKIKTKDAARGRWPGILINFGLDKRFLQNRSGECPMCGGKDRYRFDDRNGEGVYYCNQCGPGDGMNLVMCATGLSFKDAARKVDEFLNNNDVPMAPAKPDRPDPRIRLRKLAQSFLPMDGVNPVRMYLKSRGLLPSPATKYAPSVPYYEDGKFVANYPAMVHLFTDPQGAPLTYHVTYLTVDGHKAPVQAARKVFPATDSLSGGAIRLAESGINAVGIAEGIETALAVHHAGGIPTWAAYSATLLEQFQPPKGIEIVHIFADADHSFTGQKSSYALANRLVREGYAVYVHVPQELGTDFADEVSHGRG